MSLQNGTLSHRQLRHAVYEYLRTAISDGTLKSGEWLRQKRIAEELGVSQMPVREALKELVSDGLVEHIPYRGVRVIEFSLNWNTPFSIGMTTVEFASTKKVSSFTNKS